MNKRTFLVLSISLTLIACSGADKSTILHCARDTGPEPVCQGVPGNIVNINTKTWVFTPRCIEAGKTETITFNLAPPPDNPPGSTTIRSKNPEDTWLNGVNSPNGHMITIAVPEWVALDYYSYGVFKSNGDCFDPRVRIVR